jgi:hypothetical protein
MLTPEGSIGHVDEVQHHLQQVFPDGCCLIATLQFRQFVFLTPVVSSKVCFAASHRSIRQRNSHAMNIHCRHLLRNQHWQDVLHEWNMRGKILADTSGIVGCKTFGNLLLTLPNYLLNVVSSICWTR